MKTSLHVIVGNIIKLFRRLPHKQECPDCQGTGSILSITAKSKGSQSERLQVLDELDSTLDTLSMVTLGKSAKQNHEDIIGNNYGSTNLS